MREFVGITHSFRINSSLKREALLFNRIAIYDANSYLGLPKHYRSRISEHSKTIEWLLTEGLAFDPGFSVSFVPDNDEYSSLVAEVKTKQTQVMTRRAQAIKEFKERIAMVEARLAPTLTEGQSASSSEMEHLMDESAGLIFENNKVISEALDVLSRVRCIQLQRLEGVDAIPLFYNDNLPIKKQTAGKADVIRVSMKTLPMPDESTPWEQIIEYRSDPDSQSKFLALRNWMSEVARAELTPAEVEEKLEHLIDLYQRHMKLHRMKTNIGTLETVVTTGAEVLGDLVSFKWGKAAQALFSLKRRQVALLEGELSAPGNEVAYIVKARETFSQS